MHPDPDQSRTSSHAQFGAASIPAALTEIHAALVEKLEAQPSLPPYMSIWQKGSFEISLYAPKDYKVIYTARAENPEDCIADALRFIRKMPAAEVRAKHEWHKDLGKIIDKGHALALPAEVMKPLRGASQAMSKNLLTAPDEEPTDYDVSFEDFALEGADLALMRRKENGE